MPQIEVTFDIDANGILNVSAKDKATSKEQSIRIEASSGLSKQEIERMVNDAASHTAEDKKRKEEVETRNQADQLTYQTEKNLKDYGEKIEADAKAKIEAAVARVREALKGSAIAEIKSAADALNQVWQEAASKMYANASAGQPGGASAGGPSDGPSGGAGQPGPEGPGGDGKVRDADYEVVDEDKK